MADSKYWILGPRRYANRGRKVNIRLKFAYLIDLITDAVKNLKLSLTQLSDSGFG